MFVFTPKFVLTDVSHKLATQQDPGSLISKVEVNKNDKF